MRTRSLAEGCDPITINKILFRKLCNLLQSPKKCVFPATEETTPQLLVKICMMIDLNSIAFSRTQFKRNTRHRSHKNSLTNQVPSCLERLHKTLRKCAETAAIELDVLSGHPQLPDFEVAFTQSSKVSYKNTLLEYILGHTCTQFNWIERSRRENG